MISIDKSKSNNPIIAFKGIYSFNSLLIAICDDCNSKVLGKSGNTITITPFLLNMSFILNCRLMNIEGFLLDFFEIGKPEMLAIHLFEISTFSIIQHCQHMSSTMLSQFNMLLIITIQMPRNCSEKTIAISYNLDIFAAVSLITIDKPFLKSHICKSDIDLLNSILIKIIPAIFSAMNSIKEDFLCTREIIQLLFLALLALLLNIDINTLFDRNPIKVIIDITSLNQLSLILRQIFQLLLKLEDEIIERFDLGLTNTTIKKSFIQYFIQFLPFLTLLILDLFTDSLFMHLSHQSSTVLLPVELVSPHVILLLKNFKSSKFVRLLDISEIEVMIDFMHAHTGLIDMLPNKVRSDLSNIWIFSTTMCTIELPVEDDLIHRLLTPYYRERVESRMISTEMLTELALPVDPTTDTAQTMLLDILINLFRDFFGLLKLGYGTNNWLDLKFGYGMNNWLD